jgi:membrane associated rhomboid family serine protease
VIIIPIGQEKDEVRREPWVSYAIVGANVAVFLLLWIASLRSDVPARFEAKAKEITAYLIQNPYLTVPAELVPLYGARALSVLEQRAAAARAPDAWVVRRQQQKLNGMAQELFATARALPLLEPGFVPAEPSLFAAFTSMFVHAGLLHLAGNMLFFFATGPFLEDVYGRPLFLLLYLTSGLFALAAHSWQNPGSLAPVVGASGAVAGILGAFLVRLRTSRIRFLFVPIILVPWIRFRFHVPAFVFLPLWFAAQFWLATSVTGPGNVALWAHVGGFAFGAFAALLIASLGIENRWIHPAIEKSVSWNQSEGLVGALEAHSRGDLEAARQRARTVARQEPANVDAQRVACDLALEAADWPGYGAHAARLLDLYLAGNESGLAMRLVGEVPPQAMDELPLRFLQRASSFLDRQGEEQWAARFHRRIVEKHPETTAALRSLVRLAEVARKEGDAQAEKGALLRAREHPECAGEWRAIVERDLALLSG